MSQVNLDQKILQEYGIQRIISIDCGTGPPVVFFEGRKKGVWSYVRDDHLEVTHPEKQETYRIPLPT